MIEKRGLLAVILTLTLLLAGCAAQPAPKEEQTAQAGLRIPLETLGAQPSFIDWTQGGTAMQLIAIRDGDGSVRLAFNTCQSCGGSPYAWFEPIAEGVLQCQNCGLTFSTETVGTAKAAGCNPVTISEFTVEEDSVVVPESVLAAAVPLFASWKVFE